MKVRKVDHAVGADVGVLRFDCHRRRLFNKQDRPPLGVTEGDHYCDWDVVAGALVGHGHYTVQKHAGEGAFSRHRVVHAQIVTNKYRSKAKEFTYSLA
jgi:hypothetical protein